MTSQPAPRIPMTSYFHTGHRPRKRTKTFSGCWTCRGRKVKCDEGKPECQQFRRKGLECEGYGTRLRWLAHYTSGEPPVSSSIEPSPHPARRRIQAGSPRPALPCHQVDYILGYIDTLGVGLSSDSATQNQDISFNLHDFGVFRAKVEPTRLEESRSIPSPDLNIQQSLSFPPLEGPVHSPTQSELALSWDLCDPLESQSLEASVQEIADNISIAFAGSEIDDLSVDFPQNDNEQIRRLSMTRNDNTPTLPSSVPRSSSLSDRDCFLLHHYVNTVVNLFCVIDNVKSPWKTIHLPRVLQSIGQSGALGETTDIRISLRYALLSISAFYLSNSHRTQGQTESSTKWCRVGDQYRYAAIALLKQSMGTDFYSSDRPRYKEYLATMISMITINVMSGDTHTSSVHLAGAAQLISHMSTRKTRFSRKAKVLHRIYLYLHVLYESTALRGSNYSTLRFPLAFNSKILAAHQADPGFIEDEVSESTSPIPDLNFTGAGVSENDDPEMSAYECIYGIPQSLLIMLKETIGIIDQVDEERERTSSTLLSRSLSEQCDDLERRILDWPLEASLRRCQKSYRGRSAKIVYFQTKGFHSALIIYFSQQVRLLNHRYLRQYVETILDSIEAIEDIKTEANILAAPLFWPAFIGATEAFEEKYQARFRKWYEKVGIYGIKAVRTGLEVIHKVWEKDLSYASDQRFTCPWRSVVRQSGDSLMLT